MLYSRSRDTARNWTDEKWNALSSLVEKHGVKIVEIGTEKTLSTSPNIFDYTGRRDIHQLALIIKNADLFVGVDSAFAHIANAMRTPTVALFGKFMCYDTYCPYSGDFISLPDFEIIRAPKGRPASEISVPEVEKAILAKLKN